MDPLAWLFGLEQFGIKFGLESIATLVEALGHPERTFRCAHVAGTNGKGSVTAMVDAALRAAGHRSARYTSPHLIDLAERFVVDGHPVARAALVDVAGEVRLVVEALRARGVLTVHPTFFEVTTAMAFELFRRAGVTVAVCEVGLGGRLDATNVLSPDVTAITSIGFDHEQYLGGTIEEIAREKAGIVKPEVPVVVGRVPPAALHVIAAIARERRARLVEACEPPAMERVRHMRVALIGEHQVDNAAVAVAVLDELDRAGIAVPLRAVADGLANVRWPGRLEWRTLPQGRAILLDAAHNADGAAALARYLESIEQPLPLVFGAMKDKDIAGILRALAPAVSSIVCTRASTPRAADPEALALEVRRVAPHLPVTMTDSPAAALECAWRASPRIVVAGSIFLLGDVIQIAWPA